MSVRNSYTARLGSASRDWSRAGALTSSVCGPIVPIRFRWYRCGGVAFVNAFTLEIVEWKGSSAIELTDDRVAAQLRSGAQQVLRSSARGW